MQVDGREAAFVEENEEPVLERGPPRTVPEMAAGGRFQRRIKNRDRTGTTEPARKFHVFHERNGREAAEGLKGFSPNENGLIAKKTPPVPGQKTPDRLEPDESRMAGVEFAVKGPADDLRVLQRPGNGLEMSRGQNRIRMMKDKDVTAGVLRGQVHLRAAVGLRGRQVNRACQPRRLGRDWRRGSVGYDHFMELT